MRRLTAVFLVVSACACGQSRGASGAGRADAERAEAAWRAKQWENASTYFKRAVEAEPENPNYHVRWGRLFLDRFNPAEAATEFETALKLNKDHAGALFGLALVASERYDQKAVEFAEKALKSDPKMVEAQELLAQLALEDSNEKKAAEEAQKALSMSPKALDAMAVLGTIDLLDDKAETPWFDKVLGIDPKYGEARAIAGKFLVLNRRYEEGIAQYRKAIETQPDNWAARAQLGINLMRLGREGEAREHLQLCYDNHHRDPATVNTLRLMDSYKRFQTFETPTTILRLHNKEAELLRPYLQAELDRAIATYEKKYKVKLTAPVQLEIYPDHEDFAVRTMAMPGLGALGVTFGNIVAMDSPSGRKPGSYHWASTLWHELSHVYVLAATKHRVPRWFTEGMAVYEETAIAPDWGDRLDPVILQAIKDKKLLPIAELDRGFVRPKYPQQVIVSYFQAGRICSFIAKKWGYDKLLDMMHAFAKSTTTAEVVEKHLGMKPEEFDKEFLAAIDAETKKTVDGFESWRAKLKTIAAAAREKHWDEVIKEGEPVRDIYPDYVEAGSVYEFLAEAWEAKGDKKKAAEELSRYSRIGGRDPTTIKKLATLLEETGNKRDAALALDRLTFIHLHDEELHRRLGDLLFEAGKTQGAVREYRAVVAMKPLDQASARFNLARALRKAGQTDEARDELIAALEAAPGFRPAQKMLLELSEGEPK